MDIPRSCSGNELGFNLMEDLPHSSRNNLMEDVPHTCRNSGNNFTFESRDHMYNRDLVTKYESSTVRYDDIHCRRDAGRDYMFREQFYKIQLATAVFTRPLWTETAKLVTESFELQ